MGFHRGGGFRAIQKLEVLSRRSKKWDWREMGTHHSPDIQPVDIKEFIYLGDKTLLLCQDVWKYLLTIL